METIGHKFANGFEIIAAAASIDNDLVILAQQVRTHGNKYVVAYWTPGAPEWDSGWCTLYRERAYIKMIDLTLEREVVQ